MFNRTPVDPGFADAGFPGLVKRISPAVLCLIFLVASSTSLDFRSELCKKPPKIDTAFFQNATALAGRGRAASFVGHMRGIQSADRCQPNRFCDIGNSGAFCRKDVYGLKTFCTIALAFLMLCALFAPQAFASETPPGTPSGIPWSDLDGFIRDYVESYIGITTPGASIAIVQDGELVYAEGFGFASAAGDMPVDARSTVFEWGSISKLFVWVSALQLAEQGKLDLEAPISDYLPDSEMPKLQYDEPVTMLHLMNHSAGFEEYVVHFFAESGEDVLPLSEFLVKFQPRQAYPPGRVVAYSNFGTALAARIVEIVSGQSYDTYVKEHILGPLGMNDTVVTIANDADWAKIRDRQAVGYVSPEEGTFIETGYVFMSLYPSGAMNGTAVDLAKFAKALLARTEEDNVLFNHLETLTLLYTATHSPGPLTPGIAHGFWEYQGTYRSYSHSGNTKGFASNFHVVPDAGFAAVILTNQVGETAISHGLMDALLTDPAENRHSLPLDPQIEYNGTFLIARNTNHTFTKMYYHFLPLSVEPDFERQQLTIRFAGNSARYEQIGEGEFRLVGAAPEFLHMKNIRLVTDGSRITGIQAPFSDYVPANIPTFLVAAWTAAVLVLVVCMAVMVVVYLAKRKRSDQPLGSYAAILLLQIVLFANTAWLAVKMLGNPYRPMDELLVHIILAVGSGILTIVAMLWAVIRAVRTRSWRKVPFVSTVIAAVLFQAYVVYWRFYWF